jgi:hypothetical protein
MAVHRGWLPAWPKAACHPSQPCAPDCVVVDDDDGGGGGEMLLLLMLHVGTTKEH